jgi:prolyl-tRNA synthetase
MPNPNNIQKNEQITSRDVDFAQWYTDVCRKAELMDYSSVKGFIIYRPYGYAIWEQIQQYLDRRFKQTGHHNVYMPMVIPESLFQKEKDHVQGFAPETLIATIGGKEKLEDPLIIRPTSEVLFCEHFAKIVSSYRDLPKKYNQWCSVVRWEKTTRPFLRGSEFLWQEGHTIHATEEEARFETLQMLQIYKELGEQLLAIPFLTGQKTAREKFAGAEETYAIEALMHDGKSLQSGTSHYFGTGFAQAFNIQYQNQQNQLVHVHQTSWGASTRLIGALIMVHGDDNGLVLPPLVAPIQIVIIPVMQHKPGVLTQAKELQEQLSRLGYRVTLDDSDNTPGWKYAEYEMKGVPIRIEIGPRDIEKGNVVVVQRHNHEKTIVAINQLEESLKLSFHTIQDTMYKNALTHLMKHQTEVHTFDELKQVMDQNLGYAKAMWCGSNACEQKVKDETSATARVMPFNQQVFQNQCSICQAEAKQVVFFAKAY